MSNDSTICAGIDIGDRYCQIAVLDEDGGVNEQTRIRTTPKAFERYFKGKAPMRVAMEVGTHSPWISQLLNKMGHDVLVGNACKLSLIYKNNQKSDVVDAELLARICRFDPQMLYPIDHKDKSARAVWTIIRSRDVLIRARTKLINHVRGTVKPFGHRLPKCSPLRLVKLQSEVPEPLRPALVPILNTIAQLNAQIYSYNKEIARIAKEHYPQVELLQQVYGVGPITALTFMLTIGDPWRFPRNRTVGAFLGLVPRRNQTGQSDPQLSITKSGSRYLRRLLVQCANYILGPFGPDCDLKRCGERIASRGGKNAKKRARVAVARRLSVMLLSIWKTAEVYDPFHGSKNKETSAA